MKSESATYDQAVADYGWFKYSAKRGKEVSQRTHKRMIREGEIFGLKVLRSGARFTLIFPDMPHVDFPLDKKTGENLMDNSTKLRKLPEIAQREGRAKAAGVRTAERQLAKKNFDNARFAPRTVPNEYANGIDFSNYQWRIVDETNYRIKHTKGNELVPRNELIGVRFLRDSKGGVVINPQGMYLKLTTDEYDKLIADTMLLPIQEWPNGSLTDEDVKDYRKNSKKARIRTESEKREGQRLEKRAEKLAQQIEARTVREESKTRNKEEQAKYDEMRTKIRNGEMEDPSKKARTFESDVEAIPTVRLKNQIKKILQEEDLLEEEEIDADEFAEEQAIDMDDELAPLYDILATSPFAADSLGIEKVVGSLFGDHDDSENMADSDFDLSDVEDDEPDDEEEEAPAPKVKPKGKKKPVEETEEEDPEAEEDDSEEEDPEAEEGDEEDEDPDAEEDPEEEEEEEDPDAEEEDDSEEGDEEEDPEAEEDDSEEEEEDPEAEADVDETGDDEEVDEDVLNAEQEAAETAKKFAQENKNTPTTSSNAEEGDVIQLKADAKLKRDWLVLKVSSHKSSDSIVIYTLYDITNSPEEVRQIRINRARKQSLFDIATHVKDMKPNIFNRVYDMTEDYEVNKEPIVS